MAKKRKNESSDNVIRLPNGKTISLEGYLTKKPRDASTTPENFSSQKKPVSDSKKAASQAPDVTTPPKDLEKKATTSQNRPTGDPKFLAARQALPIWEYQDAIRSALRKSDVLVLVGETGSGKSTQIPQFLYQEDWCRRRKVKVKKANGGKAGQPDGEEEVEVGGVIAITQPRRVAATTLAHRVSAEVGTPLKGQQYNDGKGKGKGGGPVQKGLVGYSVRFDHRVPKGTRIKYVTEGMLLQEMLRDPHLREYSAILVDEIHERSVDVDLLSGFLKQMVLSDKAGRGGVPLKVVVMSATVNVEKIKTYFSTATDGTASTDGSIPPVELLEIEGRQFPVDIIHTPRPVPDIQEAILKIIFKIHTEQPLQDKHGKQDILAFLIGQEEIESAQRLIEEHAATLDKTVPKVKVFPLFGQMSMEAQHEAFQPVKAPFTRKIVLATNVAETSVTVPGVRFVIDCGKSKVKQFRPRLGMASLLAKPISKSSAIQRAGRAGREGPGKCFRLYTEEGYDGLEQTELPEILRTDILGAVLTMKATGIDDVIDFPLMDRLQLEPVEKAYTYLNFLKALDDQFHITEAGRKMLLFPVTAPYARVLLAAAEPAYNCLLEVIDIIACITSGEDIFHQVRSEEAKEAAEAYRKELWRREGDLLTYLTTMQRYTSENTDRVAWCKARHINVRNMKQALNIRRQLRALCVRHKLLAEAPPQDPQPFVPASPERAEAILKCFLRGFMIKTAFLHPDSSYLTTAANHVVAIHPSSVLHGQKKEALMFLEHVYTVKSYAKKVSAVEAAWVAAAYSE